MNCFKLTSTLCFAALFAFSACGTPKDPADTGDDESTSEPNTETTDNTPTDSVGETSVSVGSSSEGSVSDAMTMGETSNSTGPDTGVTTEMACPDMLDQENNAECTDSTGCGCKSGLCFLVPILGGWCGECLVDADCGEGGCSVPNPIAGTGAVCNMGEPGAGCMSDEVCTDPANLSCGTLLEVPGIISVATCGECAENADCVDPALPNCTPTYDVMNFSGKYVCVADNTVPNNEGCNLTEEMGAPVGNQACMSGFCGEALVMGLLSVGICGECNSDSDCNMGQTCSDPQVDLENALLVGSVCQ